MTPRIELFPYGTTDERSRGIFRGWKWITVDGVAWGVAVMHNRGPNGIHYTFHLSTKMAPLNDPRPGARQPLTIYSDTVAHRRWLAADMKGERPKKLQERLIDTVRLCIKHKLLISPKAVTAKSARAEEKRAAVQAVREAAKYKRWAAQIERELGPAAPVDAVMRLMEWAQSQ